MKRIHVVPVMLLAGLFFFVSCQKEIKNADQSELINKAATTHGHLKQAKTFSSEVPLAWMQEQLDLVRNPGGVPGFRAPANFAYCGIALYEAVVNGMPSYKSLGGQLTEFPKMPKTEPGLAYHWAAAANAALAYMNMNIFKTASLQQKAHMTDLENGFYAKFQSEVDADILKRSIDYGRAIGKAVLDWALTDGNFAVYPPFPFPDHPGKWVTTPPLNLPAAGPNTIYFRQLVPRSLDGSDPKPQPAYSEDKTSDYYAMQKEVYDISKVLTDEQRAIGLYYRDLPGYTGGPHYLSILKQLVEKAGFTLDQTAEAYAKAGIGGADAHLACWKTKYSSFLERPITYIQKFIDPDWTSMFDTPNHPDFTSGHSTIGGAEEVLFANMFGANFEFTNHTYDYLGMAPRTYKSFTAMAIEIGKSRVYAGIHTTNACVQGRLQGKKVAENVLATLVFKKGE